MSTEEELIKMCTDMHAVKKTRRKPGGGGGGGRGGGKGGGGGGDLPHKDEIHLDEGTQLSEEDFQDSEKALLQSAPEKQAEWAASLKAIISFSMVGL